MSASDDELKKDIEERWGELNVGYNTGSGATVFANDLEEVVEPPVPEDSPDLTATALLQDTLSGVQARLAAEAAKAPAEADAELTAPLPPVNATTPLPQVIDLPAEEPTRAVWPVMRQPELVTPIPPPSPEFATSGGKRILPEQIVEEPEVSVPTHRKPPSNGKYYGKLVGAVATVIMLLGVVWFINPGQEDPKEKPKVVPSQSATSASSSSPSEGEDKKPDQDVPVAESGDKIDASAKPVEQPRSTKTTSMPEAPHTSSPQPSATPRPSHTEGGGGQSPTHPSSPSNSPTDTTDPEPEPSSSPPATSAPPATEEPPTEEPTAPVTDEPAASSGSSTDSAVMP